MIRFLAVILMLLAATGQAFAQRGAVSAADPRAAEAGREILRAGGNATDATLAMMLALTVVEPQSSGIGGGGFFLLHDARTGKPYTIDGRETAPFSATPQLFLTADGKPMDFRQAVPGGRSVGIPGNIALMAKAHRKWGKLPWARLFDPAIRLAEGYEVTPRLARALGQMGALWQNFPAAQALYWQDGRPKTAGERVTNLPLAALYRTLASRGARRAENAFYTGDNARAIINTVAKSALNPAVITPKDLARYQAKERTAVCAPYRQYRLCGMGPPSSGATTVFQLLGMLERFDLKALGADNPESWHLIAEAMRLAYADREEYLADADFVRVPVTGLLDKDYIASRSALIARETSLPSYPAGKPPGVMQATKGGPAHEQGTTHFTAADKWGNVAAMTSTVEGPFGSQLVVNGYFLNNELTDFTFRPEIERKPVVNRVEAGKRPLSSMAPTIVYGPDSKPIFAVGAAGGRTIIMQVAKTLIARLDWGMGARDAIAAPNIWWAGDAVQVEANTPLGAMAGALSHFGRPVLATDMQRLKANALEMTADGWRGAADPRSEGVALIE
jgi:gamma-glutamyltranspeptidase / glutathione hydrolase